MVRPTPRVSSRSYGDLGVSFRQISSDALAWHNRAMPESEVRLGMPGRAPEEIRDIWLPMEGIAI